MSRSIRKPLVYLASVSVFAIALTAAPMTFDFDTATMHSADAQATGNHDPGNGGGGNDGGGNDGTGNDGNDGAGK